MTDKLAEAIAHTARKSNVPYDDLATMAIEAARFYHAIPVVDVDTLICAAMDAFTSHQDATVQPHEAIRWMAHYLSLAYPDGVRWK